MYFNIASYFYADLQEHFRDHGFHWHDSAHMVDANSLTQVLQAHIHTEDGCGGPVGLHLTVCWEADRQLALQKWFEQSEPGQAVPEEFTIPLEFVVCLPPLDNPPDLLTTWMELLGRFDDSPLRVDISAYDYFETPTDPAQRRMDITARTEIIVSTLYESGEEHHDDTEFPECRIITDLHDLCTSMEERVVQWCSANQT